MVKTTLYLPEDLHHKVIARAKREKRPQAEVLREAIRHYLNTQTDALPAFIGIANDEHISASQSEDWLVENWSQ